MWEKSLIPFLGTDVPTFPRTAFWKDLHIFGAKLNFSIFPSGKQIGDSSKLSKHNANLIQYYTARCISKEKTQYLKSKVYTQMTTVSLKEWYQCNSSVWNEQGTMMYHTHSARDMKKTWFLQITYNMKENELHETCQVRKEKHSIISIICRMKKQ